MQINYVTKVTLQRDNAICIIQGMRHVAPKQFYHRVQRDIDDLHKNGYRILFEGIKGPLEIKQGWSIQKKRIAKVLTTILSLYPFLASVEKSECQKKSITYPPDSVRADMNFAELIHKIAIRGFNIPRFLARCITSPKNILEFKKDTEGEVGENKNHLLHRILSFLVLDLFCRKAMLVILHERNILAVDSIEKQCAEGNGRICLHYGNAHVNGIVRILKKNGWKQTSSEKMTLS